VSAPIVGVATNRPCVGASGGSLSEIRKVSEVPTSDEIRSSIALLSPTCAISDALSSDAASLIGDDELIT
jgi:hypothetical protein